MANLNHRRSLKTNFGHFKTIFGHFKTTFGHIWRRRLPGGDPEKRFALLRDGVRRARGRFLEAGDLGGEGGPSAPLFPVRGARLAVASAYYTAAYMQGCPGFAWHVAGDHLCHLKVFYNI